MEGEGGGKDGIWQKFVIFFHWDACDNVGMCKFTI